LSTAMTAMYSIFLIQNAIDHQFESFPALLNLAC